MVVFGNGRLKPGSTFSDFLLYDGLYQVRIVFSDDRCHVYGRNLVKEKSSSENLFESLACDCEVVFRSENRRAINTIVVTCAFLVALGPLPEINCPRMMGAAAYMFTMSPKIWPYVSDDLTEAKGKMAGGTGTPAA